MTADAARHKATGHRREASFGDLPEGAAPFVRFSGVLREHGFAVAADQTLRFIEAVGLLGPRSMRDIHDAARATLAPPIERRDEFDALYRLVFLGHSLAEAAPADSEDELQAFDERDGSMETPEATDINEVGEKASSGEALSVRKLEASGEETVLRGFARRAPDALPRRQSLRRRSSRHGRHWDMRRSLRDAVRHDGELLQIPRRERRMRQRRIVLLIDVSGSMKVQTDSYLRFAHTLSDVAEQLEVFTVGTRLTRVSRALRIRQRDRALAVTGTLVADWDGGTRLGDALRAFLSIPRFAGFTRSALVVVLSDALERGDHEVLRTAVERLSRLAWRLVWLTPLAADTGFEPRTAALQAIRPYIDELGNGASAADVCAHLLSAEPRLRAGRPAP